MSPFLVLSLPRSRSAWLSHFLTYGEWACNHEQLRHMRSLGDVEAWFSQKCTGTAETGAAPWWRLLERLAPGIRIVTVRRPVSEVVESLLNVPGMAFERASLEKAMTYHDRKLDQIEARLPVLSVKFDDLADEAVCAEIFEHCLPHAYDPEHWARLAPINIQCNLPALARYAAAYAPQLDKLGKITKHQTLTRMALRTPVMSDGMALQSEDFETWLADARPLFDDHLVQVGEAPGDWQKKNIPLLRAIYDAGAMQIITARSNGRMFGYLVTLVTPSLTSPDVLSAANNTFYASPDVPGLGLKLQRASLIALRERGVDDVFMQAGVRGSGTRIASIYKRLGAANDGELFRLQLSGV